MLKGLKSFYFTSPIIFIFLITQAIHCKNTQLDGKALSQVYCSNCHSYPEPSQLTRDIWLKGVLPEMGLRLGVGDRTELLKKYQFKLYDQLIQLGVYPENPLIKKEEWDAIVDYYNKNAPTVSPLQPKKEMSDTGNNQFSFFEINTPPNQPPNTTLAKFISSKNEIWVGNHQRMLDRYDLKGQYIFSLRTPSPVVDVLNQKQPVFLSIGNMQPNEDRNGRVYTMTANGTKGKLLVDSLHRPVQFIQADMDNDGSEDMIIAEFGYITGQVQIVNGKNNQPLIISNQPGARNIHIRDMNKDGLSDLIILFAQARERISVFINKGNHQYQEKVLMTFPPEFGASYLELADVNKDGWEDFILSNGDNADYSICRKNYHGVRIYLNQHHSTYKEAWFYPMYGATKTISKDFDGDGDNDLATIAYFSDASDQQTFIYFENKGDLTFKPWDLQIPHARWLVMESADMEGDGDQDIILGNFIDSKDTTFNNSRNIQGLILKNNQVRFK